MPSSPPEKKSSEEAAPAGRTAAPTSTSALARTAESASPETEGALALPLPMPLLLPLPPSLSPPFRRSCLTTTRVAEATRPAFPRGRTSTTRRSGGGDAPQRPRNGGRRRRRGAGLAPSRGAAESVLRSTRTTVPCLSPAASLCAKAPPSGC